MLCFSGSDHDAIQAAVFRRVPAVPAGAGGRGGDLSVQRAAVHAAAARIAFAGWRDFARAMARDGATVRGPRADRDRGQHVLRSRLLSIDTRGFARRRDPGGEGAGAGAGRGAGLVCAAVSAASAQCRIPDQFRMAPARARAREQPSEFRLPAAMAYGAADPGTAGAGIRAGPARPARLPRHHTAAARRNRAGGNGPGRARFQHHSARAQNARTGARGRRDEQLVGKNQAGHRRRVRAHGKSAARGLPRPGHRHAQPPRTGARTAGPVSCRAQRLLRSLPAA